LKFQQKIVYVPRSIFLIREKIIKFILISVIVIAMETKNVFYIKRNPLVDAENNLTKNIEYYFLLIIL
jgi:hypothetical protein